MRANGLTGDSGIVPVVMFHSVGAQNPDWEYRHIAEPAAVFEAKIASLATAGFHFLGLHWSVPAGTDDGTG